MKFGMLVHTVDKFQLLLELRCHLFASLQRDINYIESETQLIDTQSFHLSDFEKQKYGELKTQLSAALKVAEEVQTLLDAEMAVVNVQASLLALQDSVLKFSKRDGFSSPRVFSCERKFR